MTGSMSSSMHTSALGLFAKWPRPGAVKTRLPGRTPDWGARVALAFLRDTIDRLSAMPVRRVLAFAPAEAGADFARLAAERFELVPQQAGDLGQRMAGFIAQQIEGGASAVVLVGADSPTLPLDYVEHAFRALEQADLVLGPACDGGYYLVGCGRRVPPIFDAIPWSTPRVLAETIACLDDPDWRLVLLPPWYDVDTPDDWALLAGHVAALRRAGIEPGVPNTEALLREPKP
jgi:rSAM/selenodomain-associated transferase 1